MKEYTIDTEGSWQGAAFHVTPSESKDFLSHDEIDSSVSLKYIDMPILPILLTNTNHTFISVV